MEEAQGETFLWNELKENFTKDFKFIPENDQLIKATIQIKTFIKSTVNNNLTQNHSRLKESCHNIQSNKVP